MAFTKGRSGNPAGRPNGAKDKATKEIRERIKEILDNNFTAAKIDEVLAEMDGKDKLMFLTKLLDYSLPKLKSTELKTDFDSNMIIVRPPNFDREARIKELKQKLLETDK